MIKYTLEIDSILKYHKDILLLSDIYIKCNTGDVIGLLGKNGSGKSTLLRIIFGSVQTYNKNIRINNKVYTKPYQKGNLVAYLPQNSFLPKGISIKNIVNVFLEDKQKKEVLFGDKRISKIINKELAELSGGERRYLEIMLLVNLNTKFILLDEPFSAIEPIYKETIKDLINEYKREKGFIITDHDYRNIIDVSSQLMLITNGAIKRIDKLFELEDLGYLPMGTINDQLESKFNILDKL